MQLFVAFFTFATLAAAALGSVPESTEQLKLFAKPLPKDASFVTAGLECTISSVAFPTMFLYMKHHVFSSDILKLKEGTPKVAEASKWDWRGLWTIQKHSNSRSNVTEYRFKDMEINEFATFVPSEQGFIAKGGTDALQGTLWTLDLQTGAQGSITTIRSAVPPGSQLHSWFLTAVTENGQTSSRAVIMDHRLNGNLSKWKVICGH